MSTTRKLLSVICFLLYPMVNAGAANAAPATGVGFQTFAVLTGAIIALFALAWAARKYGPYARVKKALGLDVVGQVPVGIKANITLVRVGKSMLLLGVTQNRVCLIKDLGEGDFEKAITDAEFPGGLK